MAQPSMKPDRLRKLLHDIQGARIGVVGDFCVDSYYIVDKDSSEPSIETGLPTRPVREQRSSLGGAGNVVANLHAMGVKTIRAFAVAGPDSIGFELVRLLDGMGVDSSGVITQTAGWQTHSYLKPIVDQRECNRYDFGVFNTLSAESSESLLRKLGDALPGIDILVINQQFEKGVHSDEFQKGLNELLERNPKVTALVDCRHMANPYPSGLRKLNDREATRLSGDPHPAEGSITRQEAVDSASHLFAEWGRPVFVTRGRDGCLVIDKEGIHDIPGLHIIGKTDPVGAGDSMVAGIAACLAAGASPAEAATFGNFVAGVTVQKLQQTGTAAPAEILAIGENPDYVYRPELAADIRSAAYVSGTEIEVCEALPSKFEIRYCVFDHDGTISTFRQGWEKVMERVMIESILGRSYGEVDRDTLERIVQQSRDFIDKTTGIQTLKQMHGLSLMVRDAGFLPDSEILDAKGYKKIFNDALMELIDKRKHRLQNGELGVEDFTLKNAVKLLHALHRSGLRLYLASGTDEKDVILEAEALGYASLFEGRIYGANLDITHDAKRVVLEGILREIGAHNATHVVTFGDGPVEIRETHKRGGLTVGVASDEVQRYGLKTEKRSRLIRAGANLVVPDFSQLDALLRLLRIGAKDQH
jgi:bifunctional ADP-heptose synthase (sugar kinase/adenylyltransferase)/phosphoglycolate phosphatase-like HAD superfamily hydrolase